MENIKELRRGLHSFFRRSHYGQRVAEKFDCIFIKWKDY